MTAEDNRKLSRARNTGRPEQTNHAQRFASSCSNISSSTKRLGTLAAALVELKASSSDLTELSQSFVDWSRQGEKDAGKKQRIKNDDNPFLLQKLGLMETLQQQRQSISEMKQRLIKELEELSLKKRAEHKLQEPHATASNTGVNKAIEIHLQQDRLIKNLSSSQDQIIDDL